MHLPPCRLYIALRTAAGPLPTFCNTCFPLINNVSPAARACSVFCCIVERNTKTPSGLTNLVFSRLNLIDLAGSERISSGAHGGSQVRPARCRRKGASQLTTAHCHLRATCSAASCVKMTAANAALFLPLASDAVSCELLLVLTRSDNSTVLKPRGTPVLATPLPLPLFARRWRAATSRRRAISTRASPPWAASSRSWARRSAAGAAGATSPTETAASPSCCRRVVVFVVQR